MEYPELRYWRLMHKTHLYGSGCDRIALTNINGLMRVYVYTDGNMMITHRPDITRSSELEEGDECGTSFAGPELDELIRVRAEMMAEYEGRKALDEM